MLTGESGLESQVERECELRPNDFQVAPSIYVDLASSTHTPPVRKAPPFGQLTYELAVYYSRTTFSRASRPLPMMHVRADVN